MSMHSSAPDYQLSVAPMMDWTDRHCRFFHRLIAPRARLYTEMITTGAILHGDLHRLLDFNPQEHPVALQLGGSEPSDLAHSARIGAQWGYDEINLNCGCPSERVQRGAFGACLMREPQLVADCVKAMQDAVEIPVTVKHRIGVDDQQQYSFVRDFVGALYEAGCRVFLVHARSAILKGLSPKENRDIPPLRMPVVRQLKQDFPDAVMVANGGIQTLAQVRSLMSPQDDLPAVDGVMLGRAAYHDPWLLRDIEADLVGDSAALPERREDVLPMLEQYFEHQQAHGVAGHTMTRHWHGLFHGQPGARRWRREICTGRIGPQRLYEQFSQQAAELS
ncbi:MAG: tRNA dihydrouridine(20/20a) synthase DusA [Burkholderiaceae bacterium]|nr:tRNA dihydrouridine(20/20a) synthase DusA [Burkholderiaceae bacterium]